MARRKRERPIKETAIVFCEGCTEKIYFDILKRKYRAANIEVKSKEIDGQSYSLVKKALQTIEQTKKSERPDRVIVVFDKDDNHNDSIQQAFRLAKTNKFEVAFSNECFDLWILLHFTEVSSSVTRSSLKEKLEKYFEVNDYSRIKNDEEKLSKSLEHNIRRAFENSQNIEKDLNRFSENPFTNVGVIAKDIFKIKE